MLVAALLLLGACGDDGGSDAAGGGDNGGTEKSDSGDGGDGGEDSSGDLTYTAVDYGFQGPAELPAGTVSLTLKNEGKEPHEMALIQLVGGKTIEDVQAFIKKNGIEGKPPSWAKFVGGLKPVKPGDTGKGGAQLKPGNYIAACFIPSKKNGGQPHVALGMIQPITVQ